LTFSFYLAKYIQEYARRNQKNAKNSYELALFVFREINAHFESALCMAKLGRFSAMIDLIQSKKELSANSDAALKIFKQCPSLELAGILTEHFVNLISFLELKPKYLYFILIVLFVKKNKDECLLPTDRIISIFLDSDQPENGLKFLQMQIEKLENGKLDNLKT
jgi:hypothetical protein